MSRRERTDWDLQVQEFGISSPRLMIELGNRWDAERRQTQAVGVSCACPGCYRTAKEAWFFCSRACRDTFARQRLGGPDG